MDHERLEKLSEHLLSRDAERIAWAVELMRALDDAELFDHMLRGVSWLPPARPEGYGTLSVRGYCARSSARRRWDQLRAFSLLGVAPDACERAARLRAEITSLAVERALPPLPEDHLDLDPLGGYRSLRRLLVRAATRPTHVEAVAALPHLESLTIEAPLADLAALSGAPALRSLTVKSAALVESGALASTPSLRDLDLGACPRLRDLDLLGAFPNLEAVTLNLASLSPGALARLEGCVSLRRLTLINADFTQTSATLLGALDALEALTLVGAKGLRDLSALRELPRLRELRWSDRFIRALSLGGVTSLRRLTIEKTGGDAPTDLDGLSRCDLDALEVEGETSLEDLSPLASSEAPSRISLDAPRLRSLDALRSTAGLTSLTLRDARALCTVAALARAARLTHLTLRGCEALGSLEGLEGCEALSWCDLEGGGFSDVAPIASLQALTWLSLRGCARVTDISALEALPKLTCVLLAGSGVAADALPPRLRAVANFGDEATLAEVSQQVPLDPRAPPPRLTPEAREAWPRVSALLRSHDRDAVMRGVTLARAIGDNTLYDGLLRGVALDRRRPEPHLARVRLRDSRLRVAARSEMTSTEATLALAADAPAHCKSAWRLRESLTALDLTRVRGRSQPFDARPLASFKRLRLVALSDVSTLEGGAALEALPALEMLRLLGGRHAVAFDATRMLALRDVEAYVLSWDDILRLLRAPNLERLRAVSSSTLRAASALTLDGHRALTTLSLTASLSRLALRDLPKLTRLSLWSSSFVELDLTGCAALRWLSLGGYTQSPAQTLTGFDSLTSLVELEASETFARLLASQAPAVAARIERLRCTSLTGRNAGFVAPFTGLRTLDLAWWTQLRDVSAAASLPALTQLDLRGTSVDLSTLPPSLRDVARK